VSRAFVIVLDACGVGALPDAAAYGDDPASNTLEHVAKLAGGLNLPVMQSLGLGSIEQLAGVAPPRRRWSTAGCGHWGRARSP
jgi:phosphopentomutase